MIGHFVYNLYGYSGAALQALLIARELNREVIFFNIERQAQRKRETESPQIINLSPNLFLQCLQIVYYTQKYGISVYHFHGVFNLAWLIGAALSKPLVLKTTLLGEDDFRTLSERRGWRVRKFLISRLAANIVQTQTAKEINKLFFSAEKIYVIPNGVSIPPAPPTLEDKENIFCIIGLLCKRKNTLRAIQYFHEHYFHDSAIILKVIGPLSHSKAAEFEPSYVQTCIDYVNDHKLCNRIRFIGWQSKDTISTELQKAKALLLFSKAEGLPNVVLEAMASNCVPIVSDLGGLSSDFIEHGQSGFIVRDFEKVPIEAIEALILSTKPYGHCRTRFSDSIVSGKLGQLYETLK